MVTLIAMTFLTALVVQLAAQDTRYKLVDLGTLGGPASHLPFPPPPPKVLNNRGVVAGYADTSMPDPFPSSCFNAPDCFVSHAFRWQNGVLTDLGALAAGWSSLISAMSDTGLIAGFSQNGVIDPLNGGPEVRAVLWKDGRIIDLGTLGGNESLATGVNSHGQVIGFATNTIPDPFSPGATEVRAFLWQGGVMLDLGTLGGPDSFGGVINERGQVAGSSYTSYTPGATIDSFLWQNGEMIDLGGLGGSSSTPNDLNNQGQVVGFANLAGDLTSHPFLWDRGVLTDLGTLGGDNGQATAINDKGEVVGYADLPGSTTHHAFLWKDGAMTDLGVLAGLPFSAAWYISPKGQIVGHSHDSVSNAVLWENGGPPIDLNTRIPTGSALYLQDAYYINQRGEIAGYGVPPGCPQQDWETCGHAYVLIPCDGNHTDTRDCEDGAEMTTAVTRSSLVTASQGPVRPTQVNPAHGEPPGLLAALRARLAHAHVSGVVAGPEH
jgi:probable HAF family extracellular repeat protein